jgi:hypothetical protein
VKGLPLKLYVLGRKEVPAATRPTLYFTGSIHGNEYLGLEDRLPGLLVARSYEKSVVRDFLAVGGVYVFVPIVNPDGYEARMRTNAHDIDLNRDWDVPEADFNGFKETETQSLSLKLEQLRSELALQYRVTMDYHCCGGVLLYPWSYKVTNDLPESDLNNHRALGIMMKKHLGESLEMGTTGEIFGYYPLGTTKDYFYDKYGALAFTFEGRRAKEDRYLNEHLAWWEELTSRVLREPSVLVARFFGVAPRVSGLEESFAAHVMW